MHIFNSLSGKIEEFVPLVPGKVSMYSCGPTVYNNLHIGNLSAFIYADVFRRTLQMSGYEVHHVMNITDVDDKTIRDSKRDYPKDEPKIALHTLTTKYTDIFMEDLAATGNDTDNIHFISAVDTIPEMIQMTQRIIDAGIGYITDDGVYFSIAAYTKAGHPYGLLQKIDVSESKSRVSNDEYDKDNVSDFALWKAASEGEPAWEAHFETDGTRISMPGRPGWHIECSAMSEKLLGVPFDIHTGGIDLKFPHHENEIAQTCASGATGLSTYFVHNNHILVEGRKMSKSLGNFYTLRDIEDRGYSADTFRLLVLSGHYRSESNFSWQNLEAAQNRLKRWRAATALLWQTKNDVETVLQTDEAKNAFKSAMEADIDTVTALSILEQKFFDPIEQAGVLADKSKDGVEQMLKFIENTLGLNLHVNDISSEQKQLLEKRVSARNAKDWSASDTLRDTLAEQGIGINDSEHGQIWYYL